jgi:3-oxoacyl-[acyl-carrier protein] reductase
MSIAISSNPAALVSLDGKVALISGAASGIGRAQVELFLAAGACVAALDVDGQALDHLSATAADYGGRLWCCIVDLTDPAQIVRAVSGARAAFGRIDILCNTAGVLDGFARSLDTDDTLWNRVFDVNVKALHRLTSEVLPTMLERGEGVVINMASVASSRAGAGGAAYTASKHAVVGYTRQLSLDFGGAGIRVNAICPGMIETPMTSHVLDDPDSARVRALRRVPAGRLGRPEDIANVALFLSGPGAEFIHGTTIVVDGGLLVR